MADNYLERQFEKYLPQNVDPETGYTKKCVSRRRKK